MNITARVAISVAMTTLRDQQIAWLNHITESSGLTITEIARLSRLHPSTLTRFKSSDKSGHTLTSKTVKKIEDATRTPAYESRTKPVLQAFSEDEAQPFVAHELPGNPVETALKAAASEADHIDLWRLKTNTLSAIGYSAGMVVAVDRKVAPRNGDAVCAQKYDFRRGTAETLFRVYRTPYLLTASNDGEPAAPEIVDNETVVIMGTIVGGFRLRH